MSNVAHARTPEQIIAQQRLDAAQAKAAATATKATTTTAMVPAPAANTQLALPDTRSAVQKYIDDVSPANMEGRLIKFSKDGKFITSDDGETVSGDLDFFALCDETLIGWIKFNGKDAPPDRVMGLLYSEFVMPMRDSLGDLDATQWESGLSGQPEDPWHHQSCLVLQRVDTRELFTFSTTSITGRRAIGNLLKHHERMKKVATDEVPVVRLKVGGYNHRKVGWVSVPVFAVVGKAPRDNAAKPDTSVAADMDDSIPF